MPTKRLNSKVLFKETVIASVMTIPAGETRSYKEIAVLSGHPKAYRAVATLMSKNYNENVPCHRVIYSDGRIGNYNRGGEKAKIKKLKSEGWQSTL
jgi:methylated-DNA-[protein]-cysteine S-methyltransferase